MVGPRNAVGIEGGAGLTGISFAALGSYVGGHDKSKTDDEQAGEQYTSIQRGYLISLISLGSCSNPAREVGAMRF
jgi:hypothetical protein